MTLGVSVVFHRENITFYLSLMMTSGVAIDIFKTAALALIGDISTSTTQHTSTMNGVEAFFSVGAIIGPLLVTYMLTQGVDWKWLYIFAATFCIALIVMALLVKYPENRQSPENPITLQQTLKMLKDPYALGFSLAASLCGHRECHLRMDADPTARLQR
jgi:MFS transporter, FHS family, L-fucose permease